MAAQVSMISRWERRSRTRTGDISVAANRSKSRLGKRLLLYAGATAAVLVIALALVFSALSERQKAVWEVQACELVTADSGVYLLSGSSGLSLWGSFGKFASIPESTIDAALGSGCLAIQGERVLQFAEVTPQGALIPDWTAPCSSDERLLSCDDSGVVLTARPQEGLKYGEMWILRAIGPGGSTVWEESLPGIPQIVSSSPTTVLAGLVDLSSGGLPRVWALDRNTGRPAWSRTLPPGLWRGLGFTSSGVVVAALDTGVSAFGSDGSPLWNWNRGGPVLSALIEGQTTYVATPGTSGLARILSPYMVWAVSEAGDTVWSRSMRCRPFSLQPLPSGKSAETEPGVAVALSSSCVVAFSMDTGRVVLFERTGGQPIRVDAGHLLLRKGRDIRLVEFRLPEAKGTKFLR